MGMVRAVLLLVALLLAGCNDGGDGGQPQASTTFSTSTTSPAVTCLDGSAPPCLVPPSENVTDGHRIEMLDCTTYWMTVPADTAKMEALMPAGYTLDDIPLVGLDAWVCASAVLDNATVFHDVRYFSVGLSVEAPEEVRNEAGGDAYDLEACLNIAELRVLFDEIGFQVCDGTVEMTLTGPDVHLQYFQAGVLAYEFTGVGEADRPTPDLFPSNLRIHQATDTTQSWYDQDAPQPSNPSPPGEAGPLTVHQGVLTQIIPHPGETTFARGGIGSGTYINRLPENIEATT